MIKIYPDIEFKATCPRDGANMGITEIILPGMRCLADMFCPSCGTRYYVDLPVGQAIRSPVALNQATGEIYDSRHVEWFSSLLKKSFENRNQANIVPSVHGFYKKERIIILNCLDFLYGHSLLKLLNVQRYLDNYPDLGCCVIVPSQLVHLVPDGVAEIWEFPISIRDGWKWYNSLQGWLKEQLLSRRECFLSRVYSHPSNSRYDLNRFVRNLPNISETIKQNHPVFMFSYREDRLWGRDLVRQQNNLQRLYNRLSLIFPEMVFVIVGFGRNSEIKASGSKLIDLRCDRFDREQDRLWMAYMQKTDCAIGVHGSNMLLPSGLARATVVLVPRSRLGNSVQDLLFSSSSHDLRDSLLLYRMMYGNDDLSDILPSEVSDMATCTVSSAQYNLHWFKVGEEHEAIERANAVTESAIFKKARKHLIANSQKSFIKRKSRLLAEKILEIID